MGSSSCEKDHERPRQKRELCSGTHRSQIDRKYVVKARTPLHFVAGAAVGAVQLEVALLHSCNKPALGKGKARLEAIHY